MQIASHDWNATVCTWVAPYVAPRCITRVALNVRNLLNALSCISREFRDCVFSTCRACSVRQDREKKNFYTQANSENYLDAKKMDE